MILDKPGVLSRAQDLTFGSAASTDQIKMTAKAWSGYTDLFLVVDTETIATGNGSDTYKYELRVATSEALTTYLQVLCVDITGYADARLATAGNHVLNINVGKAVRDRAQALRVAQSLTDASYIYVGLYSTVSDGATHSINAALSPTEPQSDYFAQPVWSNVGVPGRCSAAS